MGFRASVTRRSRDRYSLAALGIVLVATLLRVYTLTKQPLWYDELISVTIATYKGGLESIWNTRFYPHPPLFVALLYLLFKGFAPSEYSARLLPLFGSVLAFPLLYRYTADLLNKRVALIALLLLAFSPFHIFFSQDARPYSLLFTLVVLTLWVLHRALATNRAGWWVAHAVCLLLLLYLHYFGWLVLGGEILYMLLRWRSHRRSLRPFGLSLLIVPLGVPELLHFVRDSRLAGGILVLNAVPQQISFSSTWMTLIAGETRYVSQWLRVAGLLVFGLLALLGSIQLWKGQRDLLVLIASLLVLPFAFVFVLLRVLGHVVPPYEEKQFVIVLPLVLILAASGVEYLSLALRPRLRKFSTGVAAFVLVLVLAGNIVALGRYYTSFEKNIDIHVIHYLESQVEPGDLIVCNSFSIAMNIKFHWEGDTAVAFLAWPYYTDGQWWFSEELLVAPEDPIQWTQTLDDVLAYPRIWLVTQDGFGSAQLTADVLDLVPASLSEQLGPFSIHLLVP